MELQWLEGFFAVAVAKGYAKAARSYRYPISQPGVHQQVRRLEEHLGVRLFERVAKDRVELTSAGRMLFEHCAPFFQNLPPRLEAIRRGRFGGVLRIDAGTLELQHVVPRWLRALRELRPDLQIELFENQKADFSRLLAAECDFLVEYLPELPRGISAQRIGAHHGYLVLPASWLGGRKTGPVSRTRSERARRADGPPLRALLAAVAGQPLVAYAAQARQRALQSLALRRLDIPEPKVLQASSTDAILGFVGAGLGFSIVPWPGDEPPRLPDVHAHRLTRNRDAFPISVAWREESRADPLVQAGLGAARSLVTSSNDP